MNNKLILITIALTVTSTAIIAKSGSFTLHFNHIQAYNMNGSPNFSNEYNQFCKVNYLKNFNNEPIVMDYQIDDKTLQQIGVATYLKQPVQLHPEGLTNRYAFISDGVKPLDNRNIKQITAGLDKSYHYYYSTIMFKGTDRFNCVMSAVGSQ